MATTTGGAVPPIAPSEQDRITRFLSLLPPAPLVLEQQTALLNDLSARCSFAIRDAQQNDHLDCTVTSQSMDIANFPVIGAIHLIYALVLRGYIAEHEYIFTDKGSAVKIRIKWMPVTASNGPLPTVLAISSAPALTTGSLSQVFVSSANTPSPPKPAPTMAKEDLGYATHSFAQRQQPTENGMVMLRSLYNERRGRIFTIEDLRKDYICISALDMSPAAVCRRRSYIDLRYPISQNRMHKYFRGMCSAKTTHLDVDFWLHKTDHFLIVTSDYETPENHRRLLLRSVLFVLFNLQNLTRKSLKNRVPTNTLFTFATLYTTDHKTGEIFLPDALFFDTPSQKHKKLESEPSLVEHSHKKRARSIEEADDATEHDDSL